LGQRRKKSNGAVTDYIPRDAAYLEMKRRVLHFIWYGLITQLGTPDFLLDNSDKVLPQNAVNRNEVGEGTGSVFLNLFG